MKTKFNVGDKVLVKVEVKQIKIDKQGILYLVRPTEMHSVGAPWIHLDQEILEDDIKWEAEE